MKIEFVKEYRAKASQLTDYRIAGDWARLAEHLQNSGITLTAADAARWADAGYLPAEAAPLISDGVTPEQAGELEDLATDIAGGPEARALQVVDDLVRDGVLVNPARVSWHEDPADPTHIIVDIQPDPNGDNPR
ncbi:hypothetical protein [Actinoplanes sp. NBRC 101535]|uniref:hypothetical protein n=1 Tax=Actinoplanes sp. NBRC 101535 TaxID=3032196 RepID=UPI0024A51205|nr:hypothetical protein [Actinoplanes sp. NBRC 101535]GLY08211.1 hypothetical protein Acsp01_85900 [Actinoplanes sp. NBRC 101535]